MGSRIGHRESGARVNDVRRIRGTGSAQSVSATPRFALDDFATLAPIGKAPILRIFVRRKVRHSTISPDNLFLDQGGYLTGAQSK